MAQDLAAENRRLQARLAELTDEAARNDSLLRKTQERELELLRAATLPQLFERLIHGLRTSYQLDRRDARAARPAARAAPPAVGRQLACSRSCREVQFVDSLAALSPQLAQLEKPWLGPFNRADARGLCRVRGAAAASR